MVDLVQETKDLDKEGKEASVAVKEVLDQEAKEVLDPEAKEVLDQEAKEVMDQEAKVLDKEIREVLDQAVREEVDQEVKAVPAMAIKEVLVVKEDPVAKVVMAKVVTANTKVAINNMVTSPLSVCT